MLGCCHFVWAWWNLKERSWTQNILLWKMYTYSASCICQKPNSKLPPFPLQLLRGCPRSWRVRSGIQTSFRIQTDQSRPSFQHAAARSRIWLWRRTRLRWAQYGRWHEYGQYVAKYGIAIHEQLHGIAATATTAIKFSTHPSLHSGIA